MERTIQPEDLKEQPATRKNLILLDVRRKADYDADREKLPGAEWRDPDNVYEWSMALPKDRQVMVSCVRGGSVSNRVIDHLQEKNVQTRFIEGGIEAWKAVGGPIIKNVSRLRMALIHEQGKSICHGLKRIVKSLGHIQGSPIW